MLQIDHDISNPSDPVASPDGKYVAEWNSDGDLRLWALCPDCQAPSALLAASGRDVVNPLTPLEREENRSATG